MNNKRRRLYLLAVLVCVSLLCKGFWDVCYGEPKRNKILPINVAGIGLEVELATTFEEQSLGLMYRDKLEENGGMLFVYPRENFLSFWMKDTRMPLSIAFIKADGRIIQIESMKPYSLDTHVSKEKAKYALEMNEGWFRIHNVREGDTVKMPLTMYEKGKE